jgi:chromosome segregation ATPase
MFLETVRQSAEDRAIATQTAAAAAATERDSLVSSLALSEAEVEKLCAAAASAEEADERARTTAATTETTSQAVACEKAMLEVKVSELEHDLGTTTTDLATVGRQFSQVTNQLQLVSEAAMRPRKSNTKLSEDLEGESRGCFLSLSRLLLVY